MLVKTLLCREGRDTGLRLMAVILTAFVLLAITAVVFPESIIIWIVTIGLMPIVGLSAVRRLNDANKTAKLAIMCVVPIFVVGVLAYFMAPLGALIGISLLGLACGAYLAFLPSKNKITYVQGYHGPNMDQIEGVGSMRQRQDPVIFGRGSSAHFKADMSHTAIDSLNSANARSVDSTVDDYSSSDPFADNKAIPAVDESYDIKNIDSHDGHQFKPSVYDDIDDAPRFSTKAERDHQPLYVDEDALKSGSITELAKSWVNVAKLHQKKLILVGKVFAAIAAACLLIYLVMLLINSFSNNEDATVEANDRVSERANITRQMVKLPDGFWLALEGDVLILRWLGDSGKTQNLWHLAAAEGDKTCVNLEFNDGSQFRPMTVDLLDDGATEARFTPLDTYTIVNNVALRGSFKLCGYEFSLKGSQAALMQNPQFEILLSQ